MRLEVVGEAGVDVLRGTGAAYERLAEVADVEQADGLAYGLVLGEHSTAGVLQRHVPAAELRELGAEGDVTVVQGRVQQIHGRKPSSVPSWTTVSDMPTVSLSTSKPTTARADALIIGIRGDEDREGFAAALDAARVHRREGPGRRVPVQRRREGRSGHRRRPAGRARRRGPPPRSRPRRTCRQERHQHRRRPAPHRGRGGGGDRRGHLTSAPIATTPTSRRRRARAPRRTPSSPLRRS